MWARSDAISTDSLGTQESQPWGSTDSCHWRSRGFPEYGLESLVHNTRSSGAGPRSFTAQIQSVSPKIGLLRIHRPPVKSGKLTGRLPVEIERSDSGEIAIQLAVS